MSSHFSDLESQHEDFQTINRCVNTNAYIYANRIELMDGMREREREKVFGIRKNTNQIHNYPSKKLHKNGIASTYLAIRAMISTSPTVGRMDSRSTGHNFCTSAFKSIPIPANSIILTKAKSLRHKRENKKKK